MFRLALALSFTLLTASLATAQPQLLVAPSEVPAGSAVTVTINAPPGYYWALVGSSRDAGLVYAGVALPIGTEQLAIIASGVVGPGGSVSFPFAPPIGGAGLSAYYLMAAISLAPDFSTPIPSATVAVRPKGFYTNTPTFPQGLSVAGGTVRDIPWPTAGGDAVPKSYIDAFGQYVAGVTAALGPGATQAATTTAPIINVEQRGSGDLLNLRTNSTTVPGYGGVNPNRSQFRVLPDGGFVAGGDYDRGVIPTEGAGTRFMWYPRKGALRVGTAFSTEWNDPNIDYYSFGFGNQVTASDYGAVAFGDQVNVSSTVGFGAGSGITVSGTAGVAFGAGHIASGFASATLGYTNRAAGQGSMALGYRVAACGDYSVALGYRASTSSAPTSASPCGGTVHTGSFVFGDESLVDTNDHFNTTADNQIAMKFAGGYRFYTNATATVGVFLNPAGTSWGIISDRNAKFGVEPVDADDILRKLSRVPINTFLYKDGDGQRYIGPMAQDFHAAFGLGADDTSIRMNDLDGVALASIQALERRSREQQQTIEQLQREIEELKRLLRQ